MGKVFLVGAGPGDPDLLTIRALRLLQRADVVLHDALVSKAVLELIRTEADIVDVGKRSGNKRLTQEAINDLLVSYARTSSLVVRLKGGDPSIFGRAGEEIEALVRAGIEFEIVPGITSALACAAAAGISLTDRRHASSVVFTTAHRGPDADPTAWKQLVMSESTLVIYMPGQDYSELAHELHAAGMEHDMPCAVVSCAGSKSQQVRWSTISVLTECEALPAPSLLIVGRCAVPVAKAFCAAGHEEI